MPFQNDPFWNEVLKRLAVTGEANIKLQNEREELERERNLLQRQIDELRASQVTPVQEARDVDWNKLNELEQGLKQAQSSYKKIENTLKENNVKIEELSANNLMLQQERSDLSTRCGALSETLAHTEACLKDALSDNRALREQLSRPAEPNETKQEELGHVATPSLSIELEQGFKDRIAALELQVEQLTAAKKLIEQEKLSYQNGLVAASQKLSKVKSSEQDLRGKLLKLGEMARQKSTHSRSSSIASSGQIDTASIRSEHAPSVSSRVPFPSASTYTVAQETPIGPNRVTVGQAAVEEDQAPTPRPTFIAPARMPSFRQNEIAGFLAVAPAIAVSESDNWFGRGFMTTMLGGSIQPLIVRVGKQGPLAKEREIRTYLCPGLDHNPWCPSEIGQHGYIFVGLGREHGTFLNPEVHNIFVGIKKGKDNRRYRYLGKYQAVRVHSLTQGEWASLDIKVRSTYAKTTKEKTKDSRSVEMIMEAYDAGQLVVPCVRLQCIGFDEGLYLAMIVEAAKSPSRNQSNKRALEEYEGDHETILTRKRRTTVL